MIRFRLALSLLLPALALAVIVFGAYVRLTDAGLGCPDWPGCYGQLTVPESQQEITSANAEWQRRPLESGKAWREMIHRYLASTLGLGIVLLAWLAWRTPGPPVARKLAYALVPLVVFQGLLGMWTVTLLLKPLVVAAHLMGGLTTLALLWWHRLALVGANHAEQPAAGLRLASLLALVVLVAQIFLGGWTSTNYAALACTDFPTCQGQWWPQTDFKEAFVLWRGLGIDYEFGVLETPARTAIHFTHRLGAAVTSLVLIVLAIATLRSPLARLRPLGWCILGALTVQLSLGISNVLFGLPLSVAVAHNAGAAVLVLILVTLAVKTSAPQAHE